MKTYYGKINEEDGYLMTSHVMIDDTWLTLDEFAVDGRGYRYLHYVDVNTPMIDKHDEAMNFPIRFNKEKQIGEIIVEYGGKIFGGDIDSQNMFISAYTRAKITKTDKAVFTYGNEVVELSESDLESILKLIDLEHESVVRK